ncbi:hypothetical protein ONZ51_g3587 [Trametes cubensis]|uniref:Uncharacterized protein n=1 Tax=Trametes cubensis TaxID=1111947 RepID=A0AAD7TZU2_9APHY|nr:hypothetical protein ONZ51_g3587 [Trametes cubensis]
MRERLEYSTELRYGLAKSLLDTQDGLPTDVSRALPIDYAEIDIAFYYLPRELRAKITSSPDTGISQGDAIYRGYIAVFKVIKDLVASYDEDGKPQGFPTVSDVDKRLSELREVQKPGSEESADERGETCLNTKAREHLATYLDNGGNAEFALDCIVDRAREELSPLGKLYDAEKRYIDAVLDGTDGEAHAVCPNDLDFALVRVKLGLPIETRGVDIPEYGEAWIDLASDEE